MTESASHEQQLYINTHQQNLNSSLDENIFRGRTNSSPNTVSIASILPPTPIFNSSTSYTSNMSNLVNYTENNSMRPSVANSNITTTPIQGIAANNSQLYGGNFTNSISPQYRHLNQMPSSGTHMFYPNSTTYDPTSNTNRNYYPNFVNYASPSQQIHQQSQQQQFHQQFSQQPFQSHLQQQQSLLYTGQPRSNSFSDIPQAYRNSGNYTDQSILSRPWVDSNENYSNNPNNAAQQGQQRRSLDETIRNVNHQNQDMASQTMPDMTAHNITPSQNVPSYRHHRRGRSDDVNRISIFNNSEQYNPPNRFHSPPPITQHYHMHHSQSSPAFPDTNFVGYQRLPHSASVDSPFNALVQQNIVQQTSAYAKLTIGIKNSQTELNQLEKAVENRVNELNRMLSVQKNPTEKEFLQMKDEVRILHSEISAMYQKFDSLGISMEPTEQDKRQQPYQQMCLAQNISQHTPSISQHNRPNNNPYPTQRQHSQIPVTSIGHVIKEQPPSYITISDPAPPYINNTPSSIRPQLTSPHLIPTRPIPTRPIPPQLSKQQEVSSSDSLGENEYWECPTCTFKNLLVAECEVCYTPRPNGGICRLP